MNLEERTELNRLIRLQESYELKNGAKDRLINLLLKELKELKDVEK